MTRIALPLEAGGGASSVELASSTVRRRIFLCVSHSNFSRTLLQADMRMSRNPSKNLSVSAGVYPYFCLHSSYLLRRKSRRSLPPGIGVADAQRIGAADASSNRKEQALTLRGLRVPQSNLLSVFTFCCVGAKLKRPAAKQAVQLVARLACSPVAELAA